LPHIEQELWLDGFRGRHGPQQESSRLCGAPPQLRAAHRCGECSVSFTRRPLARQITSARRISPQQRSKLSKLLRPSWRPFKKSNRMRWSSSNHSTQLPRANKNSCVVKVQRSGTLVHSYLLFLVASCPLGNYQSKSPQGTRSRLTRLILTVMRTIGSYRLAPSCSKKGQKLEAAPSCFQEGMIHGSK
jgi:hypothetical protein